MANDAAKESWRVMSVAHMRHDAAKETWRVMFVTHMSNESAKETWRVMFVTNVRNEDLPESLDGYRTRCGNRFRIFFNKLCYITVYKRFRA